MQRLTSIQALRAVAALLVVFAHLWPDLIGFGLQDRIPNFILGASGVDLFFVISGFVMVYSSESLFGRRGTPARFFARRLVRIVPLYWLATTYMLSIVWRISHDPAVNDLTWTNVADSYLFFPSIRPGGGIEPLLGVGWTLNFEMFFYLIFAGATLLPRRWAVVAVTALFVTAVNLRTPWTGAPPFTVWFAPTILEFVFGMWIALAFREGLRVPPWLSCALVTAGAALMIRTDWDGFATIGRVIGWGGGAALIVAGGTLANVKAAASRLWAPIVLLGDASYALYLLHTFTPRLAFETTRLFNPVDHVWLYCAILVLTAVAVAIGVHLLIEKPLTRFLNRQTDTLFAPAAVARSAMDEGGLTPPDALSAPSQTEAGAPSGP
jgi:exopolysaccharide production protein ExoZ